MTQVGDILTDVIRVIGFTVFILYPLPIKPAHLHTCFTAPQYHTYQHTCPHIKYHARSLVVSNDLSFTSVDILIICYDLNHTISITGYILFSQMTGAMWSSRISLQLRVLHSAPHTVFKSLVRLSYVIYLCHVL